MLITYGTRPEFIKLIPLINEFKKQGVSFYLLFTGQHKDIVSTDADFMLDMKYDISNNRLDSIVGNILLHGDIIYNNPNKQFKYVLVQGDTTSVLAIALSAHHHNKIVIHLEAGLRTYDKKNPYPEETNRRIVSSIADIHLCPTELSKYNLETEKTEGDIYVVGNTVIDNLLIYKNRCEYTNKILVTLHRRENHNWIEQWFIEVNKLAIQYPDYEFIFPIHPNPNVQQYKHLLTNVNVIDPLSYEKMLELLIKTRLVITDSGGIQEECSFFNKKCLTCRTVTERPEAIGKSTFMVSNPSELNNIFNIHHNDYIIDFDCPFGDGYSANKIYNILKNYINNE
jgi:UDP-N-acetylglucosamine 2-epimerase (non-hydrolysing)